MEKNRNKERILVEGIKRRNASKRLIWIHIISIYAIFHYFRKYNWICSRISCDWWWISDEENVDFRLYQRVGFFWTIARMELADELDDNDGKRKTNKKKMIREILKWQRQRRRQQLNSNGLTWMLCSREMKILTQRKHENYLNKGKRTVENMLHCHAIYPTYSIQCVIENNMYVYPIWKLDRPKIDLSFCHLQYTSLFCRIHIIEFSYVR